MPDKPKDKPNDQDPALTIGGPTETPPAAPSPASGVTPAQLVPLKLGGRDFQVAPEIAEAYAEREREFSRGITMDRQAQQELQQYRQRWQQIQATMQPQQQAQGPDLNTIWFTDPQRAATLIEERSLTRARQEYTLAQAEQHFWSTFDKTYPEYGDAGRISRSLAQDHLTELLALPTVQERVDKLGEYTGREILRITRGVKPSDGQPKPRPAERASGERLPQANAEDEEEAKLPKTLGDAIRQRRQARQKAAGKA